MSGADLIGEVPAHWAVKPLRLIGRLIKGTGGSKEDVVESGVPCVRYGDLYTTHDSFIERARTYLTEDRSRDYTPIEYGDVLFAASGETIEEIGKSAVNLLQDARCGGDVVIFRPTKPNVARFFGYAMDAAPVAAQKSLAGRGTTVKHIYPDELREVVIAVPPVHEQQVIADYLDRETARLDALVAAKERVLELLTEKRRALITRAVTRGLDPRAPLRDSGIPWLGEIPAHWEVIALRFLVDVFGGATPNTGRPELWDGDIPWVSPKDMKREEIADAEDHVSLEALEASALRLIDPVVVLIVVRGMILAHSFPTATTTRQVTINQDMKALRCRTALNPHFLRRFFSGFEPHLVSLVDSAAHGTRKLETEAIGRFEVCLPPMAEQQAIVEYIANSTARVDSLCAATESTIRLLKERRDALIAAAVTGQIDVENAA